MNNIKQYIINTIYRRYILLIYGLLLKSVLYIIYPFKRLYKAIRQVYRSLINIITTYYKEILLVLFFLVGHYLLTAGLSDIFGNIVFKLSYGLLFIGISGYKFIFKFLIEGFYTLSE